MSYDAACEALAASFLDDFEIERTEDFEIFAHDLAQRIQDTIENFIEEKKLKEKKRMP